MGEIECLRPKESLRSRPRPRRSNRNGYSSISDGRTGLGGGGSKEANGGIRCELVPPGSFASGCHPMKKASRFRTSAALQRLRFSACVPCGISGTTALNALSASKTHAESTDCGGQPSAERHNPTHSVKREI